MIEEANALKILRDLIGFESVSEHSNLDIVAYIEGLLARHGATCRRVPSDDGRKSNLFATMGPDLEGGIVLSGHTDVVPVDGQDWASDPFSLTERDGKLFGRGTCDMKGFLAAALSVLPPMETARLKRPIHFAFSYDEELGCLGAPSMIDEMQRVLPVPAAVIVGEPTKMNVVSCHKGCMDLVTRVRGHSIHSSLLHRGVSAVSVAARIVSWLDARQQQAEAASDRSNPIEPPFTTYHCGVINGGTASNIVAKDCEFTTDIRVIDTEDAHDHLEAYRAYIEAEVLPDMRAISPDTYIDVEVVADIPAFRRQENNLAEAIARSITGDNQTRSKGSSTEAGQFQEAGWPTIVCGPGSIEQAHQPDEFVTVDQLLAAVGFIEQVVDMQTADEIPVTV